MRLLSERYPAYRWAQNAGYATAEHIAGLADAGLTPHHRRSFMRIRQQLTLDFDAPATQTVEIVLPTAVLADIAADPSGDTAEYAAMPNVTIEVERASPHHG